MDRQILKEVLLDQRSLSLKPDDVLRHLSSVEDGEVVVLSGVRRCGKSTLLQEIRSKQNESDYFFNFDDERVLKFTVNDFQILTELFIELYGTQNTYYFDEIQNIEGWERYIRRLRDYGNKVFVTGSNASMLSRKLGTHLTGRYIRKELFPFSFKEFLRFKDVDYPEAGLLSTNEKALLKGQFNSYFESGGFPDYLKSGNKEYLKSLYESVLYRDVMVRNNLTNEKELLELVYYISSNVGKLMSYNGLAKVVGVKNATTISNYIAFLQDSYLVFMVNKYDVSLKKQIQNAKKGYLIDLGLLRTLAFHHTEDNGRLLENLVFLELKRKGKEIYYHNRKKECDFVIKEKSKIVEAIQVSWSIEVESTYNREMAGLLDAVNSYGLKEGLILTESMEREFEVEGVRIGIKPVWKWMLE
ncbi:MAG: ATP-binding protein [Bacteroidales bacterium]|nr:ATP-binding protein [Bacteroidales bacterium]